MSRFPTAGPPSVLDRAVPVRPPVRRPHPGREEGPGQRLPARQPRPGRHWRRPHRHLPRRALPPDRPPPRQGQGPGRRRPLHPRHHLAPAVRPEPPGTPISAPATTRPAPTPTASSATTSGRSRPSASTSPSPRPPNHISTLTRPDHRTRPGSAAARPFPAGYFPVSSATLPLLAGFSTTSVVVVSDDAANFRWPGATILVLTVAAVVLIAAVQFAYHARISLAELSGRDGSPAPSQGISHSETDTQQISEQQDGCYKQGLTRTKRTRWAYDIGLFALLAGLGLAVAPLRAIGVQADLRWGAFGLAFLATVLELVWTVVDPLLRSE